MHPSAERQARRGILYFILYISCFILYTVDAFVALGGEADKTGHVSVELLRGVVKDFGLTVDIEVRRE